MGPGRISWILAACSPHISAIDKKRDNANKQNLLSGLFVHFSEMSLITFFLSSLKFILNDSKKTFTTDIQAYI